MNGGVCSPLGINGFRCTCPCGFTGSRCEFRINFCQTNLTYCQNGATCVESQPCAVSCICPSGYFGPTCAILDDVSYQKKKIKNKIIFF